MKNSFENLPNDKGLGGNKYDFTLVRNIWEDLVKDLILSNYQKWDICDCHDCILDVTALALNFLPPKYWVVDKYDVFENSKAFYKDSTNIQLATEAILRAKKIVEENPHHL